MYVKLLEEAFGDIEVILIPKTNAAVRGTLKWKDMLQYFITDPVSYLEDYFQRNQSESGFAEDKKRIGWKLGQKREDRLDTADALTTIWHNLYWLG